MSKPKRRGLKGAKLAACKPAPVNHKDFNLKADLPHGLTIEHIEKAMAEFSRFLGFMNKQLTSKNIERLETMLMPANFSSLVGEFMSSSIPKYCKTIVKNLYHNGHPDLVPIGFYPKNSILHGLEGIEIKSSRYERGWQGHNPEDTWLMVFVFDSNRPQDLIRKEPMKPFSFIKVVGAKLTKKDWIFSGRSATSRRTITASVTKSGFEKMERNWIYRKAKNS